MTPRHAVALVLVGWYLMTAPPSLPSGDTIDLNAPLNRWLTYNTFDSAAQCEKARTYVHDRAATIVAESVRLTPGRPVGLKGAAESLRMAQCVATDDPRLAK